MNNKIYIFKFLKKDAQFFLFLSNMHQTINKAWTKPSFQMVNRETYCLPGVLKF